MRKQRQQRILLAAERLLIHYGVSKTTISDIAKEAHVGVGSVYLEFTSKDEILAELAREKHLFVLGRMQSALKDFESFEDRFRAMMTARVQAFLQVAEPGVHANELVYCGCDAVAREYEAFKTAQQKLLTSLLEEHLSGTEYESVSCTILRAYSTFTPPALYNQHFRNLPEELEAMHDLVLRGLVIDRVVE
jgi:AcrR family transcriptional regulator